MSGLIPPMVSSSPPPLDDNLDDDEEEDEFGDFAAADISYGLEGEVTVAPKGDLQVPTVEPRLCNGDNTSQDSVVSGATDSGLCSASEECADRERDVMVAGNQLTLHVLSTCDDGHVTSTCSSPDLRTSASLPARVECSSEENIQSYDLSEVLHVLNTHGDTLEPSPPSPRVHSFEQSGLTESSWAMPAEICDKVSVYDAEILVSKQTDTLSVTLGNCKLHSIENTVGTCQLENTDDAGDRRSSPENTGVRQFDFLHKSDEFVNFTEFSNVEEASSTTYSRTNALRSCAVESISNGSVPHQDYHTVGDQLCVKIFNYESSCQVPVIDSKHCAVIPEVEATKDEEPWDDFSTFMSASKSGDGGLDAEFADFSSGVSTEEQKVNSSDWADVSLQQTVVVSVVESAIDDDFEDFESEACEEAVSQDYDLLLSRLENTISDLFPAVVEGASCSADCASLIRSKVWEQLRDLETSHALLYQWSGSAGNKLLLSALGVDARNILFGPRWNVSVPRFAANLGLSPLEPVRADNTGSITSPVTPLAADNKTEVQEVPAAQFDWNGSGLVNPLDLPQPSKTNSLQQRNPLVLSAEALSVLESLPDLSFLRAHLLMFPVHSGDAPSSPDGF